MKDCRLYFGNRDGCAVYERTYVGQTAETVTETWKLEVTEKGAVFAISSHGVERAVFKSSSWLIANETN